MRPWKILFTLVGWGALALVVGFPTLILFALIVDHR
jgi:hypothetical protein